MREVLAAICLLRDSGSIKKKKNCTQKCEASQGEALKPVRQCHEHLQNKLNVFFSLLLLFSRE